ncbi:hypothetical protein E2C01_099349 [Portunus trituberculatus]|uniref:Uncharacterized protein n=1 Tax=Portunus trituberculatus TaxID=210409 RepID=A0A5B7K3M0_PORTR|nr:hypothetical protein [Portunus trituberculatus]
MGGEASSVPENHREGPGPCRGFIKW